MISSAYTYYLSTYAGQKVSKYDTHKKSELRDIYNNMVKINKKSPLYKILDKDNVEKHAIDLKESARALKNVAASLTDDTGSISGFSKKKAASANPKVVDAVFIGDEESSDNAETLNIRVDRLASSQINEGNYLAPNSKNIPNGSYFFDMNIGEYSYEFSFNVKEEDNNESIQDKLVRLFNRSNVGVKANKLTNAAGNNALVLESDNTGNETGKNSIFTITPNDKSDGDVVDRLGLNRVRQEPANASFTINGVEHTASSNTFSVRHQYQLTLNDVSAGEEVQIGIKQDFDSMIENINELISTYNSMVDMAINRSDGAGTDSNKLISDINSVARYHKESLDSAGFNVLEDGKIETNEETLIEAARNGNISENLEKLNVFKKAVVAKADDISMDPMKYVNKKMISYPNPVKSLTNPYVSSVYSGMLFNGTI